MQEQAFDCDILVIGSGAAGLAAAVTASVRGLKVIVSEHADYFGGASAISGGEIWVPMNRQASGSKRDRNSAVLDYLHHVIGGYLDGPRVRAYVDHAAEALAFLEDHSHVEYELLEYAVDYFSALPGATSGLRSLGAKPFDGRLLREHFHTIRPPLQVSMILGGMALGREDIPHFAKVTRSLRSVAYVSKMLLRHVRDRIKGYPRSTRMVMGNALIGRLVLTLIERNVTMWCSTSTTELTREGRRVTGAILLHPSGLRRVRARRAVVVASGSFSGSSERQRQHFAHVQAGKAHRSPLPATNDGSGMDLILSCGGVLDRNLSQPGAFTPVSILPMLDGSEGIVPHFGDRAKPGAIIVNTGGRRFANEALNYHDFAQALLRDGVRQANIECYAVTSHHHLRKYGLGRVPAFPGLLGPYLKSGYLVESCTLRHLADKLGIDADGLEQTVRTHDKHAASGIDPIFARGETAFERAAGDRDVKPNPCVAPLGKGPYYAVRIIPGDIGTFLGVKVDANARVLDAANLPIPGLYAVGTVASSIMGGTYPGAGAMLGPALTFGYLAAQDIIGRSGRD